MERTSEKIQGARCVNSSNLRNFVYQFFNLLISFAINFSLEYHISGFTFRLKETITLAFLGYTMYNREISVRFDAPHP